MTVPPRPGQGANWRLLVTVVAGVLVLLADQLTKQIVLDRLGPDGDLSVVRVIPGVLRFIYVENTGAAFGMFTGSSQVLTFLALGVVVFLVVYFRHGLRRNTWLALALGLQMGGALGNIVDRIRHGFVIDFINVPRWPTFNVADSAVTVGVVVLGIYLMTRSSDESQPLAPRNGDTALSGTASSDDRR